MSVVGLLLEHTAEVNLDTSTGRKYVQVSDRIVVFLQVDAEAVHISAET